uniref:hypothetical protein n=1 Tax=Acetivibrio ethanolgignens TaxID=290052 RepID=UPI00155DF4D1
YKFDKERRYCYYFLGIAVTVKDVMGIVYSFMFMLTPVLLALTLLVYAFVKALGKWITELGTVISGYEYEELKRLGLFPMVAFVCLSGSIDELAWVLGTEAVNWLNKDSALLLWYGYSPLAFGIVTQVIALLLLWYEAVKGKSRKEFSQKHNKLFCCLIWTDMLLMVISFVLSSLMLFGAV